MGLWGCQGLKLSQEGMELGRGGHEGHIPKCRSFTSREEGVCALYQGLDHTHHLDGGH